MSDIVGDAITASSGSGGSGGSPSWSNPISISLPYTFPCDGFVIIQTRSNTQSASWYYYTSLACASCAFSNYNWQQTLTFPVMAGETLSLSASASTCYTLYIKFYPFQ